MSERDQIFDQDSPVDSQQLAAFLTKDGQLWLPMVEQAQCAVDEVVDVMGRATIEAILQMSAQQLAGPKQQGKATDREVAPSKKIHRARTTHWASGVEGASVARSEASSEKT